MPVPCHTADRAGVAEGLVVLVDGGRGGLTGAAGLRPHADRPATWIHRALLAALLLSGLWLLLTVLSPPARADGDAAVAPELDPVAAVT
jgi:hypothetical protein